MLTFAVCLFVSALLTGAGAPAWGAERSEEKALIVGVESDDYAPYYSMENGHYSGYCRDLLDLFAAKMGYRLVFRAHPYLRVFNELVHGDVDVEFPDDPSWLPHKKANYDLRYSKGALRYVDGISRRRGDLGKPIETLKVIAMPRGWWPVDYLPLASRGVLKIEEEPSVEATVKTLLSGHVDGIYLSEDVVEAYLRSIHQENAAGFDRTLPHQMGTYHLSTIRRPEVIEDFDRFLDSYAQEVAALRSQYGIGDDLP